MAERMKLEDKKLGELLTVDILPEDRIPTAIWTLNEIQRYIDGWAKAKIEKFERKINELKKEFPQHLDIDKLKAKIQFIREEIL